MSGPPSLCPFPWFGSKARCAPEVWAALGDVPHYVEPFAGSLAVLLARPHAPGVETVNDADGYLANFWRATKHAPEEVARWADDPVSEVDLHARHAWLRAHQADHLEQMMTDPDFFCAKSAGWWCWGRCQWIGSGWMATSSRQLPTLSQGGVGIHRPTLRGEGLSQGAAIAAWMGRLRDRLRTVRVACGDWSRIVTRAVTHFEGSLPCGIFLDPPYAESKLSYAGGGAVISHDVAAWARAAGEDPKLRIVLAGYEGEHTFPDTWRVVPWKAAGGYGSQADGQARANAFRERLWLSPGCLSDTVAQSRTGQVSLFS